MLDTLLRTTLEMVCKYHKTGPPRPLLVAGAAPACARPARTTCCCVCFGLLASATGPAAALPLRCRTVLWYCASTAATQRAPGATAHWPAVIGEVDTEERERDASGQVYMTAAELMAEEIRKRGGEAARPWDWALSLARQGGGGPGDRGRSDGMGRSAWAAWLRRGGPGGGPVEVRGRER